MSSYSKNKTINGVTYYFEEIPLTDSGILVRHKWSQQAQLFSDFVSAAPTVTGYDLIATVNGGGFATDNGVRMPVGSLQHYNDGGAWEELATSETNQYGDGPLDLAIQNNKIRHCWIDQYGSTGLSSLQLVRGAFGFDIGWTNAGFVVRTTNDGSKIANESDYRVGIAFKGETAPYLIVVKTKITAAILKELISDRGFDEYVNLDGGSSTGLRIASEDIVHPARYIHEVFYIYKKAPKTMRTLLTNPSMTNNRYPTRETYNGSYNPSGDFMYTNDTMEVTDMKIVGSDVICQIGRVYKPDGTSHSNLSGRWFMYDKDNFD